MGWFERVRKADAAGRVTRADQRQALAAFDELAVLRSERDRLMRDGLKGSATIVGIRQNVATTTLGSWHELASARRATARPRYVPRDPPGGARAVHGAAYRSRRDGAGARRSDRQVEGARCHEPVTDYIRRA